MEMVVKFIESTQTLFEVITIKNKSMSGNRYIPVDDFLNNSMEFPVVQNIVFTENSFLPAKGNVYYPSFATACSDF